MALCSRPFPAPTASLSLTWNADVGWYSAGPQIIPDPCNDMHALRYRADSGIDSPIERGRVRIGLSVLGRPLHVAQILPRAQLVMVRKDLLDVVRRTEAMEQPLRLSAAGTPSKGTIAFREPAGRVLTFRRFREYRSSSEFFPHTVARRHLAQQFSSIGKRNAPSACRPLNGTSGRMAN